MRFRRAKVVAKYLSLTLIVLFCTSVCSAPPPASGPPDDGSSPQGEYKKRYNFSTDWFTQHVTVWERTLAEFKDKPGIRYLEVGVFEGRAFIWMLENILTHPTARATGLDIFPEDLQKRFERNVKVSGFADKVTVIKGGSQVRLRNLPLNSFDIIYVDGDHSAPAVLTDAVLSWMLLKKGGILIFDDYEYKLEERPPEQRPKISVDAFVDSYSEYVETVSVGRQYIIRKKDSIVWESF